MPFQLSPGVLVTETDLSGSIPAVASSTGAIAGPFVWGPVLTPTLVDSEATLVKKFGKPASANARTFFSAANFLSYSGAMYVTRTVGVAAKNAVTTKSGSVNSTVTITDGGSGYVQGSTQVVIGAPQVAGGTQAVGTATVVAGEVTEITITEAGTGYTSAPSIQVLDTQGTPTGAGFVGSTVVTLAGVQILNKDHYESQYSNGAGVVGSFAAKFPGTLGDSIAVYMVDGATYTGWTYEAEFDSAPGTSVFGQKMGIEDDELHLVVVDSKGLWTGTPGSILEKFGYISKAGDAKRTDGSGAYYRDVVNNESAYIWWMDHPTGGTNWGQTAAALGSGNSYANLAGALSAVLSGGVDDLAYSSAKLQEGYATFQNAEEIDISLIVTGECRAADAKWVVDNVADSRKDCMAFVSPVDTTGEVFTDHADVVTYRTNSSFNVNSSYAVLDTGYKYQYDRYNDTYRWVPLNGDIAGLCARTDNTNDPWWSPGGLNRGLIKNAVKLAINPGKAARDDLYKNGINPVVSMPGQGIVLFGDKTLLAKPSAFDRINVRRLFIVLEKAIAKAAKFQLFEFNDAFTRARFRSMVVPFLRDVQGRRGIIDFRVKCDETNNTGEVIDRNEFVADIFIKPNRSINFINLNFVALRTGVSFSEVGA